MNFSSNPITFWRGGLPWHKVRKSAQMWTVRRRFETFGLEASRPGLGTKLLLNHSVVRLQFAAEQVHWNLRQWCKSLLLRLLFWLHPPYGSNRVWMARERVAGRPTLTWWTFDWSLLAQPFVEEILTIYCTTYVHIREFIGDGSILVQENERPYIQVSQIERIWL